MPTPFFAVPLRRFVDADEWEADDLAGRLGTVAHAAFLTAGFVPYGAAPKSGHLLRHVDEIGRSAPTLSRRYTAPQLARDRGADAAVLELRAQGDGGVAFQTYLLTRDGHRRCLCEAVLDEAGLAPILSGGLDDAARALDTGAARGSWLWKSLADYVCRALFLQLCRWNDLPVTRFASLPDDAKAEILKRLADGKDLAKVECSSSQLRRLVTERDGELWKAMYESLDLLPEVEASLADAPAASWKERYVNASQWRELLPNRMRWGWALRRHLLDSFTAEEADLLASAIITRVSLVMEDSSVIARVELEPMEFSAWVPSYRPPPPAPEPEPVVARRNKASNQQRKVPLPRKEYNQKRHGAGATHSPSARYQWKHR